MTLSASLDVHGHSFSFYTKKKEDLYRWSKNLYIYDIKGWKVSSYYITHNRTIARDLTHSIFFMPVQVRAPYPSTYGVEHDSIYPP
jgi:hypothetical protein